MQTMTMTDIKAKMSPLPWGFGRETDAFAERISSVIECQEGMRQILFTGCGWQEQKGTLVPTDEQRANVGYVERCVTMHDALTGLLELALCYLEHPEVKTLPFAVPSGAIADRIRAAFAAVERGEYPSQH